MSSHRLLRVQELIKRQVGEDIRREIPMTEAGLITVNRVRVSPDLRHATVYIGILGNEDQQRRGLNVVRKHRSRLQGLLAKAVVLKFTPQIRFVADDTLVQGNRVLDILDELESEESSQPEDSPPAPNKPPSSAT